MTMRPTVLLLFVLTVLAAGACGSDGDDVATGSSTTVGVPPSVPVECTDIALYEWYGSSKEEAIARAEADDRPWRIGREDDESFPLTEDYVVGRVTFEITDGLPAPEIQPTAPGTIERLC